jgi:toxin ParE1/3/4
VKLRYSTKALAQLEEIYTYIAARSPASAGRVQARIKRSIDRLAGFPYSGRETEMPGVRLLSVVSYPYLIFYAVDAAADEVRVLRIRHGAQDPSRHLD